MLSQKVDEIIQSVTSLRPMPSNITRIIKQMENPEITIDMLVGLVSLDQALTAMVLQMSNSVSLGYSRQCTTLYESIMYIGLKRLKSILLTSSATDMMNKKLNGYRFGAGELWHHALVTSVCSEWLAQVLRYPNPEEAFVSGMLHDIGKLLLDQYVFKNYDTITDWVHHYKVPVWQVEDKLFGINHARVGGMIAQRWNYPQVLVDAIQYHHNPSLSAANNQLSAIVNVANSFASEYTTVNSDLFSFEIHPETYHILKLNLAEIENLKTKLMSSGRLPAVNKTNPAL